VKSLRFAALSIWEQVASFQVLSGFFVFNERWQMARARQLRAALRSASGDGHSSALANPISFLRMARGMSVMTITGWM